MAPVVREDPVPLFAYFSELTLLTLSHTVYMSGWGPSPSPLRAAPVWGEQAGSGGPGVAPSAGCTLLCPPDQLLGEAGSEAWTQGRAFNFGIPSR